MWHRGYGYSFSWSSSTGSSCFTQSPLASSEVEERWQWPSLVAIFFYGTACAVGLTWRPLTGSLFLSSFWCRLKPGPSGERGRQSSLLQDMLVSGRPTCTTGGRSSRELTGNDPRTDRSLLTHKDGRPFLAGVPARYPGRRPWTLATLIGRTTVRSVIVSSSFLLSWLPSRSCRTKWVYASSTSTSSGALRRLLTLCTSRHIR